MAAVRCAATVAEDFQSVGDIFKRLITLCKLPYYSRSVLIIVLIAHFFR